MTCEFARSLVEAYLDDELDVAARAQVQEHLADCSDCAGMQAQFRSLRDGIRAQAPYYRAPAGLRDRVRRSLPGTALRETRPWRWLAVAASILLAVSLGWNVAQWRGRAGGEGVTQDVLAGHVRSLIGTHLLDVPSTDRHTVKPWFNGKLDFAPDVRDFAGQGFPLTGGRIDYVGGRTVAALVYSRRLHVINLFTWPSTVAKGESQLSRNGFNLVHWHRAGMTYWAVSDVSAAELQQFANLYQ